MVSTTIYPWLLRPQYLFPDKNRRFIGKSQSKWTHKRAQLCATKGAVLAGRLKRARTACSLAGAFMHSCHTGNEDMLGVFFNTIRVLPSNRTAQQALAAWWDAAPPASSAAAPIWEPPCLWNVSMHRVYQYNCNPSCPNIAY
jgi:hypothetical protein